MKTTTKLLVLKSVIFILLFTSGFGSERRKSSLQNQAIPESANVSESDRNFKTIHIFVALCDNKYQGIVPVPAKIGNGQDPNNNLYWGCGFGIRSYFRKSAEWKFISSKKLDSQRFERLVFKHKTSNFYLVADAYDGRYIKQCTQDFLKSAAGQLKDTLKVGQTFDRDRR
ncbi:hypothetical protein [Flavobacterium agri]|uniref:hypothetical protein n=1 Tax=Flavobacterium agri TaxID=2743471 RepID=UPI001FED0605|nr:hypothetical protein [Flavobacterium agri]